MGINELYGIIPLELKMTTEDKQFMDRVFEQHSRLISFLQYHYHRNYAAVAARKFKFDKTEYDKMIIPFTEQAGINIPKDLIRSQIDKVLETLKGTYWRRSKPEFDNLKSIMRVRISNNNGKQPYKRSMTIVLKGDSVFFELSLGKQYKKIKGYIGYKESFISKYYYQKLINSIQGIANMKVGDPSELVRLSDGRYILNLATREQSPEVPESLSGVKVVGVNLNMAKYIGAAALYDEATGKVLAVHKIDSQILKTIFDKLEEQSARRHFQQSSRQWKPYRKNERGLKLDLLTRDGKSWLHMNYKQLTYQCVNQIIAFAKAKGAQVIKVEKHSGFNHMKQYYKFQRIKWGKIYKLSGRKNENALKLNKEFKRLTQIANFFQYGIFLADMEQEAKRAGIELRIISPYKISQRCSDCGYESGLNLDSIKKFNCKNCGRKNESDVNAAINMSKL